MSELNIFLIALSAILIHNVLLMRFLGLCAFFGVSKDIKTSLGMGLAVIFVMVMASLAGWLMHHFLLNPETSLFKIDLTFLRTASFILVIASLVQLEEMVIRRFSPALYQAMGIYLPLITTNCAILAVAFLSIDFSLNFAQTLVYSFAAGIGFTMVIVIFASLREKISLAPVPEVFKDYPVAFITASLMALIFLGFQGLFGL
ncbi:MAG: RnfABCDGE type electron transport complex subunit A [Candidatus Ratteibacteria bacterium]|nr:RnfABCDGE type electron transport complex subunit A [Candidatus Ratteibacteria bacterium]